MRKDGVKVDISIEDIHCGECDSKNFARTVIDNQFVTQCRDCSHTNEKMKTFTADEQTNIYKKIIYVRLGRVF